MTARAICLIVHEAVNLLALPLQSRSAVVAAAGRAELYAGKMLAESMTALENEQSGDLVSTRALDVDAEMKLDRQALQ